MKGAQIALGHYAVENANEALRQMTREAMSYGYRIEPRKMPTRDVFGMSVRIENPRDRVVDIRPIRTGYAAASVAWNLAERADVDGITRWNPIGKRFSDDGQTFHGANYGQRWSHGIDVALRMLKDSDRNSRRAWVPIWDQSREFGGSVDDAYVFDGKDVPCTIGFGLRIIDDRLVMQTVMRSQSIVGVFPYDVFLFTTLQELLANELGLHLGHYEHYMLSGHVYEREFEQAKEIKDAEINVLEPMRPIDLTYRQAQRAYAYDLHRLEISATVSYDGDPIVDMMCDAYERGELR